MYMYYLLTRVYLTLFKVNRGQLYWSLPGAGQNHVSLFKWMFTNNESTSHLPSGLPVGSQGSHQVHPHPHTTDTALT